MLDEGFSRSPTNNLPKLAIPKSNPSQHALMADAITQAIGGLFGGLFAGFVGFAVDLAVGSILDAFRTISPLFIALGIVYAIFSFILGTEEAYVAGVFFALGIIGAGFLLSDPVTIIGGAISFGGLLFSFFKSNLSD